MKESCEWKEINNCNGRYFVNPEGLVMNDKGKILKSNVDKDGYLRVSLVNYLEMKKRVKTVYLHRLVAEAFLPNPNNYKYIERKDGDKLNNNVNNLVWSKDRNEYRNQAKIASNRIGKKRAVKNIDTGMEYESVSFAAKVHNASPGGIYNCCIGRTKTSSGYRWEFVHKIA